jgi:hypothetical protein
MKNKLLKGKHPPVGQKKEFEIRHDNSDVTLARSEQ